MKLFIISTLVSIALIFIGIQLTQMVVGDKYASAVWLGGYFTAVVVVNISNSIKGTA